MKNKTFYITYMADLCSFKIVEVKAPNRQKALKVFYGEVGYKPITSVVEQGEE